MKRKINSFKTKPIWDCPSGWLGILECAPFKISGSTPLVPILVGKSKQSYMTLNGASQMGGVIDPLGLVGF